jgi:hypothetical protein
MVKVESRVPIPAMPTDPTSSGKTINGAVLAVLSWPRKEGEERNGDDLYRQQEDQVSTHLGQEDHAAVHWHQQDAIVAANSFSCEKERLRDPTAM